MRKKWMTLLVLFVVVAFSGGAQAALWRVDAISNYPTVRSDFYILFDDHDDDKQVAVEDISYFSGVTLNSDSDWFYDICLGFSLRTIGELTLLKTQYSEDNSWIFGKTGWEGGTTSIIGGNPWNYSAQVVPIPGAVWLLTSGLAGLAVYRRKIRGAKR